MIAFTIGHTASYNEALMNDPEHAYKVGAHEGYEGGWIWKTVEEAEAFIQSQTFLKIDWGDGKSRNPKDFSVFKVIINNWDTDVSPVKDEYGVFNLLVDSKFF